MNRICIYPKDIMVLTGKGESTCRRIIRTIKEKLHKEKYQLVSIKEFCDYMKLEYVDVFNMINNIKEKPVKELSKDMKKVS